MAFKPHLVEFIKKKKEESDCINLVNLEDYVDDKGRTIQQIFLDIHRCSYQEPYQDINDNDSEKRNYV